MASVCSTVNIMEAIQTVTEEIIEDSISYNVSSYGCILYESYFVISSSLFGKITHFTIIH